MDAVCMLQWRVQVKNWWGGKEKVLGQTDFIEADRGQLGG